MGKQKATPMEPLSSHAATPKSLLSQISRANSSGGHGGTGSGQQCEPQKSRLEGSSLGNCSQ